MLMRFDPFRELDELAEQLRDRRRTRSIPMDAYRIGEVLHVDLDLPGVRPESIEVTVEKNVLSVKAERRWDTEGVEVVACERPEGTFTRELMLGENLDSDRISASFRDGVLRLALPVAEEAKARRVEVTAADGSEREAVPAAGAA